MSQNDHSNRRESISPQVARQIDENLRRLYQQQLEEDLPESLRSLVAQLREKRSERIEK